jgi:hypothetical protein
VGQVPSSQADAPPQPNLGVPALRVSTFQEGLFLNCFAQFTHVMVAQLLGLEVFTTSVAQASNDWIAFFLALRYLSDSEHLIDKLGTLISLGRLICCTLPPRVTSTWCNQAGRYTRASLGTHDPLALFLEQLVCLTHSLGGHNMR